MPYTSAKHSHNFAAWCAATAARRGLSLAGRKQAVLIEALESTTLPKLLSDGESGWPTTADEFDALHSEWRAGIRQYLQGQGIEALDGRAAKLIAIYIKARVVVGTPTSRLAELAHPPIDNVLLIALDRAVRQPDQERVRWKTAKWTKLDSAEYTSLVASLRRVAVGQPLWTLEKYWSPKVEADE